MNRVLAVAVTAATATMVAGAAIVPAMAAMAAQRPAGARTAAAALAGKSGAKTAAATAAESRAKLAAQRAASAAVPLQIVSQLGNGQYVTVVQCHGTVKTPPPVEVGQPDAPLSVHGSSLSAGMLATLKKPNAYKAVYACTVVVKELVQAKPKPRTAGHRACAVVSGAGAGGGKGGKRCKKVTLNTGFGGMAAKVAQHHPAG